MPELPDVIVYVDALKSRIAGRQLLNVRLHSPFVLRTVEPPLDLVVGQIVRGVRRVGKRIVLECDDRSSGSGSVFLVIHLMIAGRLRWRDRDQKLGVGPKIVLATFAFDHGTVVFTEAGSKKRASIQMVRGEAALGAIDPGGIDPIDASLEQFRDAVTREQHTLKRALTDPHLFSGIGNAYSDEILHAARLSPLKLSRALADEEMRRLRHATRSTLASWIARLRQEAANEFPEKVTAFREGMAVHGRFKKPCPVCGSPVQRIVYAENECNYCATCQTGGRLLADRSLSRLLKDDWPRRLDGQ